MTKLHDKFWGIASPYLGPLYHLSRMIWTMETIGAVSDCVITDADFEFLYKTAKQCGYQIYELKPWRVDFSKPDERVYWLQMPVSREDQYSWMRHIELYPAENGGWSVCLPEDISPWIHERIYKRGTGYKQIA